MRSSINGMGSIPPPVYNVTKTGASKPMPTLSAKEPIIQQTMRSQSLPKKPLAKLNCSTAYNMTKTGPGVTSNLQALTTGVNGLNTIEETFSVELQNSIEPADPAVTTLWQYNIPALSANEKQLILSFIGGQVLILQAATSDFPKQIFIYCDQIGGYQDALGNPTNIVAILRMKNVFSMVISGVTTYTILYEIKDAQSWPLGLTRTLTFEAGDRTGLYTLPLTSPIELQFKIMHVSY